VEIGDINPDHIITPHIFVDYIVEGGKQWIQKNWLLDV
jgi:acetate CoA/acetoacetate CoA-transferase alpha subunit